MKKALFVLGLALLSASCSRATHSSLLPTTTAPGEMIPQVGIAANGATSYLEIDYSAGIDRLLPGSVVSRNAKFLKVNGPGYQMGYSIAAVKAVVRVDGGARTKVDLPPIVQPTFLQDGCGTGVDCTCDVFGNCTPGGNCNASVQNCGICPDCSGPVVGPGSQVECLSNIGCGSDPDGSNPFGTLLIKFGGTATTCAYDWGIDSLNCDYGEDNFPYGADFEGNVLVSYIYSLTTNQATQRCGAASYQYITNGVFTYVEPIPEGVREGDQTFRYIPPGQGTRAVWGPPAGPGSTVNATFIARPLPYVTAFCNAVGAEMVP